MHSQLTNTRFIVNKKVNSQMNFEYIMLPNKTNQLNTSTFTATICFDADTYDAAFLDFLNYIIQDTNDFFPKYRRVDVHYIKRKVNSNFPIKIPADFLEYAQSTIDKNLFRFHTSHTGSSQPVILNLVMDAETSDTYVCTNDKRLVKLLPQHVIIRTHF